MNAQPCYTDLDTVIHGDALAVLRGMADNSVDAIVTDPPAGVGFMGKDWDTFKPEYLEKDAKYRETRPPRPPSYDRSSGKIRERHSNASAFGNGATRAGSYDFSRKGRDAFIKFMTDIMTEALRVLKPGGHALVWALPRTSHWTALALEDAGFEIRDCVYHIFGSGFPKSTAIDKQIDKMKGAEREVTGQDKSGLARAGTQLGDDNWKGLTRKVFDLKDKPATPEAQQWQGWGSSLKPAVENWWLVRKPLGEKGLAANVLKYGTGGLNVDACRVGYASEQDHTEVAKIASTVKRQTHNGTGWKNSSPLNLSNDAHPQGRFPSHLLLSHSPLCRIKRVKNTAPHSVNIPIVKDAIDSIAHAGESSVNEHVTLSHAGSSVLFGVDLKNDIQRGKKEVYYERTLFSDDDMLVNEVDTSISQPMSNSKLSSGNGECLSTGIGGTTALREVSGIGYSTDNLTLPRAIDTPISAINSTDMGIKGLATNGASASLLAGAVTTSEDIGTFTGASDTMTELQFSIGNTVDGSTNGTSSIMPGHSSDLHLNDIHYLTSELDSQEQVEAYDCHESCPIRALDSMGGYTKSSGGGGYHPAGHDTRNGIYGKYGERNLPKNVGKGDEGHVSRYFTNFPPDDFTPFTYQAKASRAERNRGCEGLPEGEKPSTVYLNNRRCRNCGKQQVSGSPCQCPNPDWEIIERGQKGNNGMSATNTHPT